MISPPLNIGIRYIIKCKDSANRAESKANNKIFAFFPEVQPILQPIFALAKIGKTYLSCKIISAKIPQRRVGG